jgi:uncharacterized protein (DUF2236 family)
MHDRVKGELPEPAGRFDAGTPYSAYDADLMLWTVAVIADSAEVFYETFCRKLGADEKESLWQDYLLFGELFGMPRSAAPESYVEFRDYWDGMWRSGDLHLTERAREVAMAIAFEIPMPRHLHPQREVHNLVLTGTLPSHVRKMFRLRWTPLHEASFRAIVTAARGARPVTPKRVRRGGNIGSFEMVARTERSLVAAGRATLRAVQPLP